MRVRCRILLAVLVVGWTAAPAPAQWVFTPYLGVNIAGDLEEGKGGPGGSIAYFGGRLGFEFDFERYNHFFRDEDVVDNIVPDPKIDLDTDAMSFMGNVMVPIRSNRTKKWRPYGAAGLGLIHAWFNSGDGQFDANQDNFAFNVGGGVMYSSNKRVGFRVDVRYFRALVDESKHAGGYFKDYGFWRVTVGVTFGFPR